MGVVRLRGRGDQQPGSEAATTLWATTSGVGNASTFQMVPGIMGREMERTAPNLPADARRQQSERESAAIIGFTSAIAAYDAFYIPKAYGTSIDVTGTADAALWGFLAFYVSCAALTWIVYSGPRGILRDLERGRARSPVTA